MFKDYLPLLENQVTRQSLISNDIVEFCFSGLTKHFEIDNYFYFELKDVVFTEMRLQNSWEAALVARSEPVIVKVTVIRHRLNFDKFVFLIKAVGETITVNEFHSCKELEAIAYLENNPSFFELNDDWEMEK